MRGADGFFLFIAKKISARWERKWRKGESFDEKTVGANWGQIGGKFSKMPREPPKKHEKTGFKPVLFAYVR